MYTNKHTSNLHFCAALRIIYGITCIQISFSRLPILQYIVDYLPWYRFKIVRCNVL